MRRVIGLAAALLVLGLGPALQAQTPTSPVAASSYAWQPSSVQAPLNLNNALRGLQTGMINVWNVINPFPAQPQGWYSNVPQGNQGMSYLQQFGYRVAQPAQ
jgi:hypothetical protein